MLTNPLTMKEWKPISPKCPDVDFPLNMHTDNNSSVADFSVVIDNKFKVIRDTNGSGPQYRFIWIDAIKYCGIKYAIYKCLDKISQQGNIATYYFSLKSYEQNDLWRINGYEIQDDEGPHDITAGPDAKVFLFDYAENISEPSDIKNFSYAIRNVKNAIFIFVARRSTLESNFWQEVVNGVFRGGEDPLDAIIKGVRFRVDGFTNEQLMSIIQEIESLSLEKKQVFLQRITDLDSDDHLRRAYFLDRFIKYILDENNPIPENFESFNLLLAIYESKLLEFYDNAISSDSQNPQDYSPYQIFKNYLAACNKDITSINDTPLKQFVWAYGIAKLISENRCDDLKPLFELIFKEFRTGEDDEQSVFEEVFELIFPNKNAIEFLLELTNYKTWGAVYSLGIIYKFLTDIRKKGQDVNGIFVQACKIYASDIGMCPNCENCIRGEEACSCQGEIKPRYALGRAIGVLLPNIDGAIIKEGLSHIFKEIKDDYILPQVDCYSGISVCPITNFEYKKFVDDGGYDNDTLQMPDIDEVRKVYYKLYEKLIGILITASETNDQLLRSKVATALRGSTWRHYKHLSYILKAMSVTDEKGEILALKRVLEEYYGETISAPVKWKNPYRVMENFCNPLQPVVGISLFEAKAYTEWLSQKSGKPVRLVKFNPDYLKVVGDDSVNATSDLRVIREKFARFKSSELLKLINIREHTKCYYGPIDQGEQGPAPVGLLPQYKCSESILDFLGNIYEMQSTLFDEEDVSDPNIPDWQKVYNCSGGGWQHSGDHLPTDYMGQFTALTRNQDIGFRVVIGDYNDEFEYCGRSVKNAPTEDFFNPGVQGIVFQKPQYIEYVDTSNSFEGPVDLDKFTVKLHADGNIVLLGSKTFKTNGVSKNSIKIFSNQGFENFPEEAILLCANEFDVFAYHIQKVVSTETSESITTNDHIGITFKHPMLPQKNNERKNWSNRERAAKIEMIEIVMGQARAYYFAVAVDIVCGRFVIDSTVNNEFVTSRDLFGLWEIVCDSDYELKLINETIIHKINADFFMPDWMDFFRLIELSSSESGDGEDKIDNDTTMSVLSTIDTADLHKLIDTKK